MTASEPRPSGGDTDDETAREDAASSGNQHDDAAVTELFGSHLDFADGLARRYSHGAGLDEDLQQVAHLALLLACRRFDPSLGRFLRFASMTIVGELKKHLRSHGWAVHVPRRLQEDSIAVARSTERLTQRLGRPPRVSEISADVRISVERVTEAVRVHAARFRAPLDEADATIRSIGDPAEEAMLNVALETMSDDDRALVTLRYEDGLTQREIGERLGVSQPEAHRRINRALTLLRQQLDTPHEKQGVT